MYTINLKSTVKFKFPYMKFKTKLSNIKAIKHIIGLALAQFKSTYIDVSKQKVWLQIRHIETSNIFKL
jgi:hypothetical protein